MSETVLFVGGPYDAELREVEHPSVPFLIMEPLGQPRSADAPARSGLSFSESRYTLRPLGFLGTRVLLMIHSSLDIEHYADQRHICDLLLSDKAKAAAR